MSNMLILRPASIAALSVSRGSGAANLLTADPKEVWADSTVNSAVNIDIDFGASVSIDTVFLGHIQAPAAGASWTISGGAAAYTTTTLKASGALRVPDAAGQAPGMSHAFWTGTAVAIRYLRLSLMQPAGNPPLQAGVVMAGKAFRPIWNREWGGGRRVIDMGTKTPLPSGGFATLTGGRKAAFSWTFGDLTDEEVDELYALLLDRGETSPVLVVEDPDATVGLRNRLHYGLFDRFEAYERQAVGKTRWSLGIEQWV